MQACCSVRGIGGKRCHETGSPGGPAGPSGPRANRWAACGHGPRGGLLPGTGPAWLEGPPGIRETFPVSSTSGSESCSRLGCGSGQHETRPPGGQDFHGRVRRFAGHFTLRRTSAQKGPWLSKGASLFFVSQPLPNFAVSLLPPPSPIPGVARPPGSPANSDRPWVPHSHQSFAGASVFFPKHSLRLGFIIKPPSC